MNCSKRECIKNINLLLEKILENFTEVVELLRVRKSTKLDEMKALVFGKRTVCELTENLQKILQNLVQLKYIHRNLQLNFVESIPEKGFENYFKKLNENLEITKDIL
jgi:hypothetical protein